MKDLSLVGFSQRCPRCVLHKSGDHGRARFHKHTEVCRARVYKALSDLKGDKNQKSDEPLEPPIQDQEPFKVPDDIVAEQFDLEQTMDAEMDAPVH